ALQLWGRTKCPTFQFSWSERRPSYFDRDHPNEQIEDQGRYCELFVVGIHLNDDPETCDQLDVNQWRFMVVPARELRPRQSSMKLNKALREWPSVAWDDLKDAVEVQLLRLKSSSD